MEIEQARIKFEQQRAGAKSRGIEFCLTFQEWIGMWGEKIDQRGRFRGQYVMCRRNDAGAYAVGNCYIATGKHNHSVRGHMDTRTHAMSPEMLIPKYERFQIGDPLYALIAEEELAEQY